MARPKTPLDVQDRESLLRIASLASNVLSTLRYPGRGRYSSENSLAGALAEDGVTFSRADLSPALGLLQLTQKIQRPEAKQNSARPGWLSKGADVWAEMDTAPTSEGASGPEIPESVLSLIKAIVRALTPGNGRSHRSETEQELLERLHQDGVIFDPDDVPAALSALHSNGDGDYDIGQIPGVPYKIVRTPPKSALGAYMNPWAEPGPDWGLVLASLRPY
jgi:hypothetical protein